MPPSFGQDVFVAKINPAGSLLVYSSYLGGSKDDVGLGIAADSSSNAYVTGYANSANFPTMNSLQPVLAGTQDAFLAEINANGALVYPTYFWRKRC